MARPSSTSTVDPVEQRMIEVAEQVGRILGTVQAKADGWVDRKALSAEFASVRDKAAEIVKHLAGSDEKAKVVPRHAQGGRSGGAVDAPGKKHRQPPPKTHVAKSDLRIPKMIAADQTRHRRKFG